MKKRIGTVLTVLVLACAVIALYLYIDRSGSKEKETEKTPTQILLEKNLETNYPPTPYSVAELYCGIIECIYHPDTTEEQLEELVKLERGLFDEEFAAINSYEQLLTATKDELEQAKEKKLVFTGYILDKSSNVERWKKNGNEYASLQFQLLLRNMEGSGTSMRNLIMRKDANGRYKILGWEIAEQTENAENQ